LAAQLWAMLRGARRVRVKKQQLTNQRIKEPNQKNQNMVKEAKAERRGGRRVGAGRRPGITMRISEETFESSLVSDEEFDTETATPLNTMLYIMRRCLRRKDYQAAARIAEKVAPYCHPRMSTVQLSGNAENPIVSVAVTVDQFEVAAQKLLAKI
jgi:hypothetical protein